MATTEIYTYGHTLSRPDALPICRVDEHRDAAFGDRADFAQGHGDHVGGESDGLGVEIAARERFIGVGKDQRIVRHAIRLDRQRRGGLRSEEHTSELQSIMRNSYAVFCLKKKTK